MTTHRFVVLSDLHAHPWAAFSQGEGANNSRLVRTLIVLDASLAKAREESIPWIFPGDLVHTAGFSLNVVLSGVLGILTRYPDVRKIVIWGNHDARSSGGKITIDQTVFAAMLHTVPNLFVLDPGVVLEHEGLTIVGEGYQPHPELLSFGVSADIGIFHQTVRGSITAAGFDLPEGVDKAQLLDRYRVSIVGHVHHPQQIEAPRGQAILIPGSPEHHNFGDAGTHGWWILSVPDDREENSSVEFISGGSPEFMTVDDPSGIADDGNFYRVRTMPRGTTLPAHATVIAPEPTTVVHRDLLRGAAEIEQILQVWLKVAPPEDGVDVERCLQAGRELLATQDPVRLRAMRLTQLRLQNFCSHEDSTLKVQDGTWLVIGKGRDYPSNGAGKTSIFEALYWLLFGQNTKGLAADEVVRWGQTECVVEGHFIAPDGVQDELMVTRRRGTGGHTLEVFQSGQSWGATSVAEMTKKLNKYLGLTPEMYQNLGYFSQEKLLLFSSATDGERKNVLADLVGLGAYQEASAAAGVEIGTRETRLTVLDATRVVHEEMRVSETVRQSEAQAASQLFIEGQARGVADFERCLAIHQADPAPALFSTRVALTRAKIDHWMGKGGERQDRETRRHDALRVVILERLSLEVAQQIKRLEDQRDVVLAPLVERLGSRVRVQEMANILPQSRVELERAVIDATAATAERVRLDKEVAGKVSTARSVEAEVERARVSLTHATRSFAAGKCPSCLQTITPEHQALCLRPFEAVLHDTDQRLHIARAALENERLAAMITQETEATQLIQRNRCEAVVDALVALRDTLTQVDQISARIPPLHAHVAQLGMIADEQAVTEIAARLASIERRVHDRQLRISAIERRVLDRHDATTRRFTQDLENICALPNPHLREVAAVEERLTDLAAKIAQAEVNAAFLRQGVAIYTYWRHGFSKQGIQSLLMEEIATRFNAHRADIFPVLTQGVYDVQFATLSQTKAGELRERTEFLVTEHGNSIPYGALSGGQRRRVDIGIMLTLAVAVADWMQVPGILGLLVLDEVFGFLDASGAEGLLDALRGVQRTIPTIYTVTHDQHLQALFPDAVVVEQDRDGVSHLIVAQEQV
jgi:DNA repair exonuclease SbcCD ATPase subunit/DNA repair exonuclease SbcCD nuclease subunit